MCVNGKFYNIGPDEIITENTMVKKVVVNFDTTSGRWSETVGEDGKVSYNITYAPCHLALDFQLYSAKVFLFTIQRVLLNKINKSSDSSRNGMEFKKGRRFIGTINEEYLRWHLGSQIAKPIRIRNKIKDSEHLLYITYERLEPKNGPIAIWEE